MAATEDALPADVGSAEDEARLVDEIGALVLGEGSFRELERALDVFCPFEALGVVRQEIRHSNFLAYVLDPALPHGFGSRMLERLVRAILEKGGSEGAELTVLDIYLRDFSRTEVRREWRHVDLLTATPMGESGLVVAVELKIEAEEHGDQLSRMRREVEAEWPGWTHLFVFLTPDGRLPSEMHGAGWRGLDLGGVLHAFEQELLQDEAGHPDARRLLHAYIAMLRRNYVTNPKHEQIAADLWRRHPQALAFLAERRPDIRNKVVDILFADPELPGRLSEAAETEVVVDSRTPNKVRFAVKLWDQIEGFQSSDWTSGKRFILFEIFGDVRSNGDARFSIILRLGKGDPESRARFLAKLLPDAAPGDKAGSWTRLVRVRRVMIPAGESSQDAAAKVERDFVEMLKSPPVREIFAALAGMAQQELS